MKTTETTRFTSALSESVDWQQAVDEVCSQVRGPDDPPPDLVVMFFSSDHSEDAEQLAAEVHRRLQCDALLGTSAESVLGRGQEVEQQPAISLWAGWLPGASLLPMKLDFERTPEGGVILGWPDDLPEDWQDLDWEEVEQLMEQDDLTFRVTITDSRGRSAEDSKTVRVQFPPREQEQPG